MKTPEEQVIEDLTHALVKITERCLDAYGEEDINLVAGIVGSVWGTAAATLEVHGIPHYVPPIDDISQHVIRGETGVL